ncbi:Protein PROTON GRADIENT REGULATION 5, chloroplastic [Cymbomonas tetramitiformis]|uniref:Protein PROTON GRADIENT REGULATION 5, chloroplastic n=1 Tax=Cymbomonas tetramitiformis TaxID=36881 RepID=A0AAE0GT33_9CHLO|nr:Protein PROTON GRADIENT REGULATION 5, chloroplastic [Cymbomonas tetramitiformis]|eukprot:gene13376-15802_t
MAMNTKSATLAPSVKAEVFASTRVSAMPRTAYVARKTQTTVAGQSDSGTFAPIMRVARDVLGKKEFNKLRGKGIQIHSQVIGNFCAYVGVEKRQQQGMIRQAKKTGEKLGFLI